MMPILILSTDFLSHFGDGIVIELVSRNYSGGNAPQGIFLHEN